RSGVPRSVAVFQPLPEPLPPVIGRLQISREALRGCSVLVVEDDADARELLALTLEEFGALVQTAANAALGMEALQAGRFDVLVSDVSMPGEDGYSFVRRARAAGFSLPSVALTANARREDRERALAAGFGEHLTKPIEPLELVAVLLRVLQR
ncbi:MAG TPA: response regulator, partial [Myxococcales bacterium]|nr:response regulator [Myxococcales bacterium]